MLYLRPWRLSGAVSIVLEQGVWIITFVRSISQDQVDCPTIEIDLHHYYMNQYNAKLIVSICFRCPNADIQT